ncbi:MAG: DUF2087 domain-containing protein [Armatimonadetes bacterium]|nr:DUF2087 domain-containing protein [Armatimonadota bacterium]
MDFTRCFDGDGRLSFWPMKRRRALRVPILDWLVSNFPKDKDLTEKEVNTIIQGRIATMDHVYFRRVLVDTGRLERTPYGDRYWLPAEAPAPATGP